jgi:DNA polymerase III subunit chi
LTEVTFHFNVPDAHQVDYVCRVVRAVAAKGNRIVVTGEPETLRQLDVALWTFEPLEFVPHCRQDAATPEVLASSPVVLSETARGTPHHQLLFNLGPAVPEGFERFERLTEFVTQDEGSRAAGRTRNKHYRDRGYPVRNFNATTKEFV